MLSAAVRPSPLDPSPPAGIGREMYDLVTELYPICRSLTGDGVRATLDVIRRLVPLAPHEVPTGTRVFDWTVPKEWNVRDAYLADERGERVIDFRKSNLHVASYSVPVKRTMTLEELDPHLFSLPDRPDRIPYRLLLHPENWGLCLTHEQRARLAPGRYEVCIDSTLEPGHLTYGEVYLPGASEAEVLVSCHVCHPSLCNDNLSGIALATFLARHLERFDLRYSYRFIFVPGTIGSITWLALNEARLSRIAHGVVLTNVGDGGPYTYKKSRRGDAEVDRAFAHVLARSGAEHRILEFAPYGYDERQFCSPGIDLPMGCFMRSPAETYPEYHTSADDLDFVRPEHLAGSFGRCLAAFHLLERNRRYVNLNPKCEPQLGRRGIYRAAGRGPDQDAREVGMLWVLNLSDGRHTLLDVAERSGLPFPVVDEAAARLLDAGLLEEATPREPSGQGRDRRKRRASGTARPDERRVRG